MTTALEMSQGQLQQYIDTYRQRPVQTASPDDLAGTGISRPQALTATIAYMEELLAQNLNVRQAILDALGELDRVVERIQMVWRRLSLQSSDERDFYFDSIALNMQTFYTGIERLLLLAVFYGGEKLPTGEAWDRQLLVQAAGDLPGVRMAMIGSTSLEALDALRRFRRVVWDVHPGNFVPEKIEQLIHLLTMSWPQLRNELTDLADSLARTVDLPCNDSAHQW